MDKTASLSTTTEPAPAPERDAQLEGLWDQLDQIEAAKPQPAPVETEGGVLATAGKVAKDIGGGILEIPGQVNRGVASAINETSGAMYGLVTQPAVKWVHENLFDMSGIAPGIVSGAANPLALPLDTAVTPKAETVTGGLVKEVSQFASGYFMAGRFLKIAGMAAPTTTGAAIAQGAGKGALADMFSFDPHEERLSNFIEKNTSLRDPVTQFLAARPEDSEALGRLKNATEGLGLGIVAEGLILGLRFTKAIRAGNRKEALKVSDEMEKAGFKPEEVDLSKDRLPDDPAKPSAESVRPANDNPAGDGAAKADESVRAPLDSAEAKAKTGEPDATVSAPVNDNAVPRDLPLKVDETKLRESIELSITESAYGQGRNLSGIRTDLIENGDDLTAIMSATQRLYREELTKLRGGDVLTHAEIRQQADSLADIVGTDSTAFMERIATTAKNMEDLPSTMLMYRDVLATAYQKLVDVAKVYHDPLGGVGPYANRAEVTAAFVKNYEIAANIQGLYRGQQTQIARALGAMRINARADLGALKDLDGDFLRTQGEYRLRKMAGQIITGADNGADGINLKGVSQTIRGGFGQNLVNALINFRTNAMLSAPSTQTINLVSSTMAAALRPAEKFIAGARLYRTEAGRAQMQEAAIQYGTMIASVRDGVSAAAKAFRLGEPVLDAGRARIEVAPSLPSTTFNIKNPVVARVADALGTVVNLPGRTMMSMDEFVKQVSYLGEVRASAYREAFEEGSWKTGDFSKFGQHVTKRIDESTDELGRALNATALEKARESTFTNDLKVSTWFGNPSLGESVQRFAGNHPSIRVVMPFIRTPTNLVRFAWDRTPGLNMARKEFNAAIMGERGAQAHADAVGKMAMGGLLWTSAISLGIEGRLTGSGPANPHQRKALEATGWRPYSVRTKNADGSTTYTSYQRLDPFAMFLGMSADYAELSGQWTDETVGEFAGQASIAILKQLTSKSYLQGLTEVLDALKDPEKDFARTFRNMAGSFVPNALSRANQDPYMREVRSVLDGLKRKTPGFSEELDPVRNILGEPVTPPPTLGPSWLSPVVSDTHRGNDQPTTEAWKASPRDDLKDELARLSLIGDNAFAPPGKTKGNVDLTEFKSVVTGKTAYDRYQELTGLVKLDDKTLQETMQEFIRSPEYRTELTDGDEEYDGSRIKVLKAILGAYRQAAEQQLGEENPEVREAVIKDRIRAHRAMVPGGGSEE